MFPGGAVGGASAVNLADDFRLQLGETGGGFVATRPGFGYRPLILIEHGQFQNDPERPFVVALIVLVAGTQMHIGILFRDLELELSLGGGVVAQRAENVRATLQRDAARFGGSQFGGRTVREFGR